MTEHFMLIYSAFYLRSWYFIHHQHEVLIKKGLCVCVCVCGAGVGVVLISYLLQSCDHVDQLW